MIYFVSENQHKFLEYKSLFQEKQEILSINIPLLEIQALTSLQVCEHKLKAAKNHPLLQEKDFFIEDTALYFCAWKNFPGVYIKWMLKSLGTEGIYQSLHSFTKKAIAECNIGYFSNKRKEYYYFQGRIAGIITKPTKKKSFGWDPLFIPDKQKISYAQMTLKQKNLHSHRALATKKFQQFLENFKKN